MQRILVLLIVLGLLTPSVGFAGPAVLVAGNPFAKPSFKNDSSGTVSALPVQEGENTGFIRPDWRHPALKHPPSSDFQPSPAMSPATGKIIPERSGFPWLFSHGLPPECGMTVVRLARADH